MPVILGRAGARATTLATSLANEKAPPVGDGGAFASGSEGDSLHTHTVPVAGLRVRTAGGRESCRCGAGPDASARPRIMSLR